MPPLPWGGSILLNVVTKPSSDSLRPSWTCCWKWTRGVESVCVKQPVEENCENHDTLDKKNWMNTKKCWDNIKNYHQPAASLVLHFKWQKSINKFYYKRNELCEEVRPLKTTPSEFAVATPGGENWKQSLCTIFISSKFFLFVCFFLLKKSQPRPHKWLFLYHLKERPVD